jgi:hypothetical protein
MDDDQRSLRSSHGSPIAEPHEGRLQTLLQFPLLFQQLNIIDADTLIKLMAIVKQAHDTGQFVITEDTADGQDGKGEFRNMTYEPSTNPNGRTNPTAVASSAPPSTHNEGHHELV